MWQRGEILKSCVTYLKQSRSVVVAWERTKFSVFWNVTTFSMVEIHRRFGRAFAPTFGVEE